MSDESAPPARLQYFPISFFAMVMGLGGLTLAWHKAQQVSGFDLHVHGPLLAATATVFVLLLGFYGAKLVRHRAAVLEELHHPIKLNFFPTISISLLLLAIAFLAVSPAVSRLLWWLGASAHLAFTLYVVNVWIHQSRFEIHHMNPAWFIPAVGNVLVPIAGAPLGYLETSWFFFSVGMLFWIVLMTIVFYRVLFHEPIPERLTPTLFILIAPPAVGFIAYTRLAGELDAFGRVLYYSALFLTLLMFTQARRFARLGFFLSSWAYSFPLAAMTIASLSMYELGGRRFHAWTSVVLLLILTAVVATLLMRTAAAVKARRICVPEQ